MAVAAASPPRNISKSLTFDRDRLDALERIARGLGVSLSAAVARLVDLHAGAQLDALENAPAAPVFEIERWKSRRLTGDLVSEVAGRVREGATKADAYRASGVPPKTGARWEKKGHVDIEAESSSLYADLVSSLERARAEFNIELVGEAKRQGDYKTLLKVMDPEQFSPVARSSVDVTHRHQLLLDWDRLTIEKKKLLVALIREASVAEDDPAVTRTMRPAVEAIPADVAEEVEDGEWTEAPSLESAEAKARALEGQKPER